MGTSATEKAWQTMSKTPKKSTFRLADKLPKNLDKIPKKTKYRSLEDLITNEYLRPLYFGMEKENGKD